MGNRTEVAGMLKGAAGQLASALKLLNTEQRACAACSVKRAVDLFEYQIAHRLSSAIQKLNSMAEELKQGGPDAVRGTHERPDPAQSR